jgi:hypothetical protein
VLSHFGLPGVTGGRQGVSRRINEDGLLALALVRALNEDLGIPMPRAVEISATVVRDRDTRRFSSRSGIALFFPIAEIEARVRQGLVAAVEAGGDTPRGRPPRQ